MHAQTWKNVEKARDVQTKKFDKSDWKTEIAKVMPCFQRQDSLKEQMTDLYMIANVFGFYDAADSIRERFMMWKPE